MTRKALPTSILAAVTLLLAVVGSFAQNQPWSQNVSPLGTPTGMVNDYAGVLDEGTKQQIEQKLRNFKDTTATIERLLATNPGWSNLRDQLGIFLDISADFIASEYCYRIEMKRAIQRHKKGTARVIPVIVRSADWKQTVLKALTALPTDGKPISKWDDTDEAWLDVAQGIRAAVQEMRRR